MWKPFFALGSETCTENTSKEWGIAPGTLKYFVEYTKQLFGAQRNCFALDVGELLRSSNFHSININDMRGAEKLLNAVVRINRKTGEDNLQGALSRVSRSAQVSV